MPPEPASGRPLRVLIVAEHASARFGGEAALPMHYFRVLLRRGLPVWLITHARVRAELVEAYPNDQHRIRYVEDTALHRWLWRLGEPLPARLSYITTGFLSRFMTQWRQRAVARRLVHEEHIDVVHQPMPVSPKEPSLLHGLGAPVVIGPLNGGMDYPAAFQRQGVRWVGGIADAARLLAGLLNRLMPGKRRAAVVAVANQRTRAALPPGLEGRVVVLPENGVDLALWQRPASATEEPRPARFVFMGRLVDWKAVDLLLEAFAQARPRSPMSLTIIGDGPEGAAWRAQADTLGLSAAQSGESGGVWFAGWRAQAECAAMLRDHDALVLPSLWECGGAVVLEAMACGLPVIATAWGGPLDYLDADCGVLVEPSDRAALISGLAQALVRLAADPAERQRLGAAGRQRVERDFDWERKVDTMLSIYREASA
ncbi:MAG: glycosyltransferase family 4 protein [Vitreoscilla sp.]|nr:glycosyltransferase family 4 protein [Vitreoscilla sp.]